MFASNSYSEDVPGDDWTPEEPSIEACVGAMAPKRAKALAKARMKQRRNMGVCCHDHATELTEDDE